MMGCVRRSVCNRPQNKRRRRTTTKSAARRAAFRAVGWELLEGRVLLTVAGTITWTGGSTTSSNWSDPANWNLDRAPINGDSLVFPASAQRLANNDDIGGLSVNSITFQGTFTTTTGGYTLSGDDLTIGAGGIVDSGNNNGGSTSVANQINFNLALAAAQNWSVDSNDLHQLTVNGNVDNNGFALAATGNGIIDIAGQISGSGSLTAGNFTSTLTLDLDHANTYTGGTQVNSATVVVSADGALGPGGTNDAGTTVGTSGDLVFNSVAYSTPETITVNGGTLQGGGNASFSGPITFTGLLQSGNPAVVGEISDLNELSTFTLNGPTLTNDGNASVLIEGGAPLPQASGAAPSSPKIVIDNVISGAGGLWLINADLTLGAVNTYQGITYLDIGVELQLGVNNAIPSGSAVVMQAAAQAGNEIQLGGHSDAIGSLAGEEGNVGGSNVVDLSTGGSLILGVDNSSTTFDGNITGSGTLTKVGSGTFDLTGATDYTGATYVSGGTFIVDGSTAAGNAVVVGPGTLGGAGTIGGTITVTDVSALGGTLDPGAGPDPSKDTGTLSNTGGVVFEPSGPIAAPGAAADAVRLPAFAVQLGGSAASPTSDQLDSASTVSFLGSPFLDLTALAGAGPFKAGQQFVIVQAGAPISGTFNGLPEGSTVSDGTQNFTISYANDRVTLTAQAAPSTYLNGQAGDGTAATFVHNLYRELLGREPDASGQAFWVNVFAQASSTGGTAAAQQTLVGDFLNSTEYRQHLVEGMYTDFLHRAADAGGLEFWAAQLAAGVDEKTVLANIVGSEEYFSAAGSTLPGWVNSLYHGLLGRTADSSGLAFWTSVAQGPPEITGRPPARSTVAFLFLSTAEANEKLLNGNYPGAAGSVGAPGTPADGAYALADITGNGWDNLYFQGNLSTAVVDTLFAQLQGGESYDQTIAGMLEMSQYFG